MYYNSFQYLVQSAIYVRLRELKTFSVLKCMKFTYNFKFFKNTLFLAPLTTQVASMTLVKHLKIEHHSP